MHRLLASVLALASLLALGCSGRSKPERAAPSVSRAAAPAAPRTPPNLREADVRALVDHWLDAQNRGDFAAYSPLYASRFTGVRRTRNKVRRFDHDGWLADRRRMFARPMQVAARDVVITTTPANAEVRFTQVWSSGRYSDEGTKRLLIVQEGNALRIAIEEMLETRTTDDLEARLASGQFLAVAGATTYVVFASSRDTGAGAPTYEEDAGTYFVRRAPSAELAARLAPMQGRALRVLESTGRSCATTIGEPTLLRVITPHFGTVAMWDGEEAADDEEAGRPWPRERIAEDAWNQARTTLAAAPLSPGCSAGIATFADAPSPAALPFAELTDADRARLIAAFDEVHMGASESADGENAPSEHSIESRQLPDGRTLVQVSRTFNDGCAPDTAYGIYVLSDGQPTELDMYGPITNAFELGGSVELITVVPYDGAPSLHRLRDRIELLTDVPFSFDDCLC